MSEICEALPPVRNKGPFLEQTTGWLEQMRRRERPTLVKLLKLGGKVQGLLRRRR